MAQFVKHEPCPRCGSRNNLGRYSDGSAWCFGCSYHERGTISPFVTLSKPENENSVKVPDDLGFDFPPVVVDWLAKYGITVEEAMVAGIKWSPSFEQLTFLFKDENNNVLFTQARNFNQARASKRKYYNQGSPVDVLPIFSAPTKGRKLVVTEDVLSSLKIARQCDAMPALGTHLPARKIMALTRFYETLLIWLDADKFKEAQHIADNCKWVGLSARAIYSQFDPKEYSNEQIFDYIR